MNEWRDEIDLLLISSILSSPVSGNLTKPKYKSFPYFPWIWFRAGRESDRNMQLKLADTQPNPTEILSTTAKLNWAQQLERDTYSETSRFGWFPQLNYVHSSVYSIYVCLQIHVPVPIDVVSIKRGCVVVLIFTVFCISPPVFVGRNGYRTPIQVCPMVRDSGTFPFICILLWQWQLGAKGANTFVRVNLFMCHTIPNTGQTKPTTTSNALILAFFDILVLVIWFGPISS